MLLLHVVILSVVQGITEFLPISSSGHLVLTWRLLEETGHNPITAAEDQLAIDIAVHVGTLLAVVIYFRHDLWSMLRGVARRAGGHEDPAARLAFNLVLGSLPLIVVGYFFHEQIARELRDLRIIGWTTLGFGILLYLADRYTLRLRLLEDMKVGGALFVGLFQVVALIPGSSRSGVTMTAARLLGYERPEAARFSMLLAIPAILGAGALAGYEIYTAGKLALGIDALIAAALSFAFALAAIAFLMRWLHHAGFTPFVVYRILLGSALLWLANGGTFG